METTESKKLDPSKHPLQVLFDAIKRIDPSKPTVKIVPRNELDLPGGTIADKPKRRKRAADRGK